MVNEKNSIPIPYNCTTGATSTYVDPNGIFTTNVGKNQYPAAIIPDVKYVYLLAFFTFLEIGLLSVFHSSMVEMARILLVVNVALFVTSYAYVNRWIALLKKSYGMVADEG